MARGRTHRGLPPKAVVVEANFNNDIVGNSSGGDGVADAGIVRVYSEGPEDSMSRSLARYIERVAAVYVPSHRIRLMARHDRFNRGSDHSAFNQHGYPAVVVPGIERELGAGSIRCTTRWTAWTSGIWRRTPA